MASYKLSKSARADLIRIHQWGIRNHGETQGDKYYFKLIDHLDTLASNPRLYPPVDPIKEGYRRSVCGKDSVYYRIKGDTVEIMAILGQQDTKAWLH